MLLLRSLSKLITGCITRKTDRNEQEFSKTQKCSTFLYFCLRNVISYMLLYSTFQLFDYITGQSINLLNQFFFSDIVKLDLNMHWSHRALLKFDN